MTTEAKGPRRLRVELPPMERFPRVGKIRLGEQVPTKSGGSLRPSKIDYFRVEAEESGVTSPEAAASFHEVYGERPTSLRAVLPGSTPADVFEGAFKLYGQSKLKRLCDGTACDERTATGGWAESPCICSARGYAPDHKDRCKLVWSLQVLLPDVLGIGVWQIDTSSEISVRRVGAWLQMMHGLTGDLAMVEFVLDLVETKVAPEGKATSVYVLQPRATDLTPRQMLEGGGRSERVQIAPVAMPALPPPAIEYDEDTGEVMDPQEDMPEGVPSDHLNRLDHLRGFGLTDAEIGEVCKANGVASAKGLLDDEAFERVKDACWELGEEKARRAMKTDDLPPF
jgi:hypothetical protein